VNGGAPIRLNDGPQVQGLGQVFEIDLLQTRQECYTYWP
ncbi:uncharacterized protein METZ01_LOCUS21342, partial [marine metagenome]